MDHYKNQPYTKANCHKFQQIKFIQSKFFDHLGIKTRNQ